MPIGKVRINGKWVNASVSPHSHGASAIASGTLASARLPVVPIEKGGTNAKTAEEARRNLGITPTAIGAAPAYTYGTADMTAGVSALETGKLYFVYE